MSGLQGAHVSVDKFGGNSGRLRVRLDHKKHNRKRSGRTGQNAECRQNEPFS
jgi:hypothetical protein